MGAERDAKARRGGARYACRRARPAQNARAPKHGLRLWICSLCCLGRLLPGDHLLVSQGWGLLLWWARPNHPGGSASLPWCTSSSDESCSRSDEIPVVGFFAVADLIIAAHPQQVSNHGSLLLQATHCSRVAVLLRRARMEEASRFVRPRLMGVCLPPPTQRPDYGRIH